MHAIASGRRSAATLRRSLRSFVGLLFCQAVVFLLIAEPIAGLALALVLLPFAITMHRARARRRRVEQIFSAWSCVEAGNLDAAARVLADVGRSDDAIGELAQASMGIVCLRQGRSQRAVWLLSTLLARPGRRSYAVWLELEHALAYAYAAAGATGAAEEQVRAAPGLRHASSPLNYLLLCRQRRFSEVLDSAVPPALRARLIPTGSALVDAKLGWHGERVIALLSAFACWRSTPAQQAARPCRLHEFLRAARPTYQGEYDYLQEDWDELRIFMHEHVDQLSVTADLSHQRAIPRAHVVTRRARTLR